MAGKEKEIRGHQRVAAKKGSKNVEREGGKGGTTIFVENPRRGAAVSPGQQRTNPLICRGRAKETGSLKPQEPGAANR